MLHKRVSKAALGLASVAVATSALSGCGVIAGGAVGYVLGRRDTTVTVQQPLTPKPASPWQDERPEMTIRNAYWTYGRYGKTVPGTIYLFSTGFEFDCSGEGCYQYMPYHEIQKVDFESSTVMLTPFKGEEEQFGGQREEMRQFETILQSKISSRRRN